MSFLLIPKSRKVWKKSDAIGPDSFNIIHILWPWGPAHIKYCKQLWHCDQKNVSFGHFIFTRHISHFGCHNWPFSRKYKGPFLCVLGSPKIVQYLLIINIWAESLWNARLGCFAVRAESVFRVCFKNLWSWLVTVLYLNVPQSHNILNPNFV